MTLRQLLNAAYAYLAEGLDKKGRAELDATLTGKPARGAKVGMDALMAAANMPQKGAGAGPRPRRAEPSAT